MCEEQPEVEQLQEMTTNQLWGSLESKIPRDQSWRLGFGQITMGSNVSWGGNGVTKADGRGQPPQVTRV